MNLKILKLRSGEEIACQVLEENDTNIKVFQPMLFKTTSSYDFMGRTIDVTTLQDWLSNTDDKNINIPTNHIVHVITPNTNTTKLYILESEKEFNSERKETVVEENKDPPIAPTPSPIKENNKFVPMFPVISVIFLKIPSPKSLKASPADFVPSAKDWNALENSVLIVLAESIAPFLTSV